MNQKYVAEMRKNVCVRSSSFWIVKKQ